MATTHEIALYDRVEILEPSNAVPTGATGTVIELHEDDNTALVEFTSMPAEPILDRLEFVPIAKLRRID